MVQAKFQDLGTSGSGEVCYTTYKHGGHLGHMTKTNVYKAKPPFSGRLHIKFGNVWPNSFRVDVCK